MNQKIRNIVRKTMALAMIMAIFVPIVSADIVDDIFGPQTLFQKLLDKLSTPLGKIIGIVLLATVVMILIGALSLNPETKEQMIESAWHLFSQIVVVITWKVMIVIVIGFVLAMWGLSMFRTTT